MPVLQAKASEGPKLDAGTYEVICADATTDQLPNPQFGDGNVLRLKLQVVDMVNPDGSDVVLDAIANLKLSPMSKLWGWIEAFGFKLEVGQDFDTDQLKGLNAYAVVGQREGQDGALWPRVESIIPLPKQRASSTSAASNVSGWWAYIREEGFTVKEATDKAEELYDKHPKDMSPDEREAVFTALVRDSK